MSSHALSHMETMISAIIYICYISYFSQGNAFINNTIWGPERIDNPRPKVERSFAREENSDDKR
jgi:hypothetical protein